MKENKGQKIVKKSPLKMGYASKNRQNLPYEDIIFDVMKNKNYDADFLGKLKKEFAQKYKLSDIPNNIQLIKAYNQLFAKKKKKVAYSGTLSHMVVKKNITSDEKMIRNLSDEEKQKIESVLKKRAIRSQSGIVAVQVLTKPWPCPGKCIFCPNDPSMPKSYIRSEPGAMRAGLNKFDPIKQVYNRLRSLIITGHQTDKIELIVLGGTWDCYTRNYKINFVKNLYDAISTFSQLKISTHAGAAQAPIGAAQAKAAQNNRYYFEISNLKSIKYSKTLDKAIKRNEKAKNRVIGLTIETRPEFVTDQNCVFWRELGVTRVEMGIQSLYDDVLKANKRGHTVQQAREACHRLRQYGFKFCLHVMPGLYKSSYVKDLKTFKMLYSDLYLKPDEIKFYPTSVIPGTELCRLYKKGEYKPLTTEKIKRLIIQTFLDVIPPYTRIKRLIRDIPATEILSGSKITNLSQLVHEQMKKELHSAVTRHEGRVTSFYKRLYGDYKLISRLTDSQINRFTEEKIRDGEIETFIIGSKPDVKSYRDFVSLDTRSREIRNKLITKSEQLKTKNKSQDLVNLIIRRYRSSVGMEYFISFEDQLGYLYAFCRLLLSQKLIHGPLGDTSLPAKAGCVTQIDNNALIRELHVYGQVEKLEARSKKLEAGSEAIQHKGLGKQLMEIAEKISKVGGYQKIAVIAGVGVREYYRKLGYKLENTYMVKNLRS